MTDVTDPKDHDQQDETNASTRKYVCFWSQLYKDFCEDVVETFKNGQLKNTHFANECRL